MPKETVQPQSNSRAFVAPNPEGGQRGMLVPLDKSEPKERLNDALRENEEFIRELNRLASYVDAQGQQGKLERRRKTVKLRNQICGNYLGFVDDTGKWIDKSDDADGLYYDPETATYVDVLVASIVKSRPVMRARAKQEEKIDKRETAKVAQIILDSSKENATAKKTQKEVKLNLIAAGETYRYTYFNPEKQGHGFDETVYQPFMVGTDEEVWYCPMCNQNGKVSRATQEKPTTSLQIETGEAAKTENPAEQRFIHAQTAIEEMASEPDTEQLPGACPNCAFSNLKSFQRKSLNIKLKRGTNYKNIGDVESEFVDPLEMTVFGECDSIADALAVQRNRTLPRCVLEDIFEDTHLPSTTIPYYLRKNSDANSDNLSENQSAGGREFEPLHFQETWLAPAVYSRKKFPQDTILKNGSVIKRGTRWREIFPRGLYFARVADKGVNLYGQASGDCWSHSVNSVSEGFHGIGEWDLSAMQDQLNEVSSMKMNSLLYDSTSPLVFRSKYIQGGQLKNKFGLTIPVGDDYPLEHDINDIARRVPTSPGIPEAYSLAEDLRSRMVNRTGAMTSQSGGMADMQAVSKTATGYQLWYEHTLGRRAPMLALRAEMEVEQAYQILELKQKYWCAAMLEFAEKETGAEAVKWFLQCDIRRDIVIEVIPDSWMPQTETQKKVEFREFLEIIAPLIEAKPEIVDGILSKVSDLYRSFDLTEHQSDTTEAQIRIERIIEIAEFVEKSAVRMQIPAALPEQNPNTGTFAMVPNPYLIDAVMNNAAQVLKIVHAENDSFKSYPVDLMFDDHAEFEKVYTKYLKTGEGRRASGFVRACVNHLAIAHRKASFELLREIKRLGLAAEEPQMTAEQIVADAEHQRTLAQNEDVHAQSLEQQGEAQMQQMAIGAIGEGIASQIPSQ